jgi:arabinogalactan endo-1,4-beta-galactosidase
MKIRNLLKSLFVASLILPIVTGCGSQETTSETSSGETNMFSYEDISFKDNIGTSTNDEDHDYGDIVVNKLDNDLREDFAYGVDASMTYEVENHGGIYYNQLGQEQDVFQILRKSGVNFVRFRLWNNPESKLHKAYGGGNNSLDVDIDLARRAKAANMNVMIDFHYSDFWADPDHQNVPRAWGSLSQDDIPEQIEEFTKESLKKFKDEGITVDAVQIGNEINNGMSGYQINWNKQDESYKVMAGMISKGISGAKEVFPNIKTIIHLANGGNKEEFESFFTAMDSNNVNYDIIGASYYPHLSGSLDELQANLDNISEVTGKPVMVVETSWGFTDEYNEYTENSYSSADEEVGGYLTSEQAQATCLRDICNVLGNVPNKKGLGIFYWEPGWLPVEGAGWATASGQSYQAVGDDSKRSSYVDGKATWSNQGLFSYTGKALSSLSTYSYLKDGHNETSEVSVKARHETGSVTINLADNETLPTVGRVETNLDAIRNRTLVFDESAINEVKTKGVHTDLKGILDGKYEVTYSANCIQNFIKDPGFENQGESDTVKAPWVIDYSTPNGEKVIKLDRKKDIRSGKTDLNWFHSSSDYTFKVSQEIKNLPAGTYTLKTYIMGIRMSEAKHTKLDLFVEIEGKDSIIVDYCSADYLKGWSEGYQEISINDFVLEEGANIKVGLIGAASAKAWAHNDDWELVNNND